MFHRSLPPDNRYFVIIVNISSPARWGFANADNYKQRLESFLRRFMIHQSLLNEYINQSILDSMSKNK